MLTYQDLITQRRSIRDFQDKKVPAKILEGILEDVSMAPSACNTQPWQFVVVEDMALMKKISDHSKANILKHIEENPDSESARFKTMLSNPDYNVFYNAPCLIFVIAKNTDDPYATVEDGALGVSYLMWAATERGLGTCWIGLGRDINDPELLKTLGISGAEEFIAPIILGYPKELPKARSPKQPVILKHIK